MGATVSSASRRKGAAPEINVTPLVDVVLVLLIIFMVVTPQMESGEAVELPSIMFPDDEGKGKLDPIELTATASGRILVHQDEVAREDLEATLRALHESDPNRRLLLRGDVGLRYGAIRELYALCEEIGFPGVSLVVSEKPEKEIPKGMAEPS